MNFGAFKTKYVKWILLVALAWIPIYVIYTHIQVTSDVLLSGETAKGPTLRGNVETEEDFRSRSKHDGGGNTREEFKISEGAVQMVVTTASSKPLADKPKAAPVVKVASFVEGWYPNTSRNTSDYILPKTMVNTLLPENFCKHARDMIVFVCTATPNFVERDTIRQTWGSEKNVSNFTMEYYFMMGRTSNETVQKKIEEEFTTHGDIVQENFMDSYNNLTLKSLMILKLVTDHCLTKTKFVMKTDDDMFINTMTLAEYFNSNKMRNQIVGHRYKKAAPVRNNKNKWFAPYYLFDKTYYPDYVSGTGYVMTVDVVPKLLNASLHIPIFHLEDVYVTGILAEKLKIPRKDHPYFQYSPYKKFVPCFHLTTVITAHRIKPKEIRRRYKMLKSPKLHMDCKRKARTTQSNFFTFLGLL